MLVFWFPNPYNDLWLLDHRRWIGLFEFLAAVRTVKDRNGISSTRYKPHHICACRVAVRAWYCNGTVWSACRSSSVYFSCLLFIEFLFVFHKYWSPLYFNIRIILWYYTFPLNPVTFRNSRLNFFESCVFHLICIESCVIRSYHTPCES